MAALHHGTLRNHAAYCIRASHGGMCHGGIVDVTRRLAGYTGAVLCSMGVEEGSAAVERLRSKAEVRGYLGSMLRITLSDERVVIGTFQCMDEHMNFILQGASEKRVVTETIGSATVEKQNCRQLGAVLVPGKHVVKVEVQREVEPDPLIIRGTAL